MDKQTAQAKIEKHKPSNKFNNLEPGKIIQFQRTGPQPETKKDMPETWICQRCSQAVSAYSYGWIRARDEKGEVIWEQRTLRNGERGTRPKEIPCPTCSPDAIRNLEIRRHEQELDRMFGGSNIPSKMQKWTFASYPKNADMRAMRHMQIFASGEGSNGVYLYGDRGHCKTGLAVAVANDFLARHEQVLYIRALTYYRLIREQMFEREIGGQKVNVLDLSFSVKLLILDDAGAENPTPFVCSTLLELIEERRNNPDLFTIITSNKTIKQLAQGFRGTDDEDAPGYRVAERIAEDFEIIKVEGEKQRSALDLYD